MQGSGDQGILGNKAVLIGGTVVGLAAIAGLAYYVGTRRTVVKRSSETHGLSTTPSFQTKGETSIPSQTSKSTKKQPTTKTASTVSGFTYAKDATITLGAASRMTPEQLHTAINTAQQTNDLPSLINLLYMFATAISQASQGSENAQQAQELQAEAFRHFEMAYRFARDIKSDMEGPIVVEMGVLKYSQGQFSPAMQLIEVGVALYLRDPGAVASINEDILISFFFMLYECYSQLQQQQRGIKFFEKFIKDLTEAGIGSKMKATLYAHIGEFLMDLGAYEDACQNLEKAYAGVDTMRPAVRIMFHYHYGVALVATKHPEEGVKQLEEYISAAKEVNSPASGLLDALILLLRVYGDLDKPAQAAVTADSALAALRSMDPVKEADTILIYTPRLAVLLAYKIKNQKDAENIMEECIATARKASLDLSLVCAFTLQLADIYTYHNKRDQAIAMLEEILKELEEKLQKGEQIMNEEGKLQPLSEADLTKVMLPLMRLHAESCQKNKAAELLERMLLMKIPGDNEAWFQCMKLYRFGKLLTIMGQLKRALKALEEAQTIGSASSKDDSRDLELKTLIHSCLLLNRVQMSGKAAIQEQLDELLKLMDVSVTKKLLPMVELETDLGEVYMLLGDFQAARKHLEGATTQPSEEKGVGYFAALVRLVVVYSYLGQIDKAEEALQKAHEISDKDGGATQIGSYRFSKAFHLLYTGNFEKALQEVRELQPYVDPGCQGATPLSVFSYKLMLAEALLQNTTFEEETTDKVYDLCDGCLEPFEASYAGPSAYVKDNALLRFIVTVKAVGLLVSCNTSKATLRASLALDEVLPKMRHASAPPALFAEAMILFVICSARIKDEREHDTLSEVLDIMKRHPEMRRAEALVKRWVAVFYGHYLRDFESADRMAEEARAAAEDAHDFITLHNIASKYKSEEEYHATRRAVHLAVREKQLEEAQLLLSPEVTRETVINEVGEFIDTSPADMFTQPEATIRLDHVTVESVALEEAVLEEKKAEEEASAEAQKEEEEEKEQQKQEGKEEEDKSSAAKQDEQDGQAATGEQTTTTTTTTTTGATQEPEPVPAEGEDKPTVASAETELMRTSH
eukprot:TRINITY_DN1621_c0_g1_i1.p1 TRINITY_DN1621_c0_g1~~TRINITY_DN1621_c0_g1_i1.p1  ORF type:complete len:1090 (-),score=239.75 TRINITY_DN1621_c0_g1_i1:100-3369(-)